MKKVIVTIDTEGHDGKDPVSCLIWGKTDSGSYGIEKLIEICDSFDVQALFFVDIAEAWDYGEQEIADVINFIEKSGHNTGVHIHPDHMADKSRLFLWEYSYDEQYEIILKCTELYKKITGKMPVAFRAGKYGANTETLDILSELGYRLDFSQFFGQKWCGINPPLTRNTPCRYKNIIEVPVTVYESISLGKFKRYDKIDASMNSLEYRHVMNNMKKLKDNLVISLFYHSFSLLNWRKNPDNVSINQSELRKFTKALEYIKKSSEYCFVDIISLDNEMRERASECDGDNCFFKNKNIFTSYIFTLMKALQILRYDHKNNKANVIIGITIVGLIFILSLVLMLVL